MHLAFSVLSVTDLHSFSSHHSQTFPLPGNFIFQCCLSAAATPHHPEAAVAASAAGTHPLATECASDKGIAKHCGLIHASSLDSFHVRALRRCNHFRSWLSQSHIQVLPLVTHLLTVKFWILPFNCTQEAKKIHIYCGLMFTFLAPVQNTW